MWYSLTIKLALVIFCAGVFIRIVGWIRPASLRSPHKKRPGKQVSPSAPKTFHPKKPAAILRALIPDTLMLARTAASSPYRWCMHMLMLAGFAYLLLFHALDLIFTSALFPGYESTLNPWLPLRDIAGVILLAGVVMALACRLKTPMRRLTGRPDKFILGAILVIVLSGFVLEATSILSVPVFDEMVEDYMATDDPKEVEHLRLYWARNFGIPYPDTKYADSSAIKSGGIIHEENCAACHSRPHSAFLSYFLSRIISFLAGFLNHIRADLWLRYIHAGACLAALAMLPFTKFLHIIATPVQLLAARLAPSSPTDAPCIKKLALDACTGCGQCSLGCSVAPMFETISNPDILPSNKIKAVKDLIGHKNRPFDAMRNLADGNAICTHCFRCTELCPSGINLQAIWKAVSEQLAEQGLEGPLVRGRLKAGETAQSKAAEADGLGCIVWRPETPSHEVPSLLSVGPELVEDCIQCQICTDVCPVVASENPEKSCMVTPQQVLNLLRMGLVDVAAGVPMVWNCTTCYKCQEHCPRKIPVADIFYALRSRACAMVPIGPEGSRHIASSGTQPEACAAGLRRASFSQELVRI